MSDDRKPLPRCPIDRAIARLTAAQVRHAQLQRLARLQREVAVLGDPAQPGAYETFRQGSNARIDEIMKKLAALGA
ncbi:hypothetical protein [Caulobacter sp. DWR2-3-1b2]|uniref:hypothetical protein n=1 Tax=unclassified Caulobacter TaxID=2648921 RepID=UPI0019C268F0|nr:hypothetical protein [Caulobacter sp.]